MKKFIHIRSKIPANISINGEKINHSNPDIICDNDFYIAFFPTTTEKYLPCAISTNGMLQPSCIKQIPYKDNHYEILYSPPPLPVKEKEFCLLNKKYNNCHFNITNSNQSYITIASASFNHASTTNRLLTTNFKGFDGFVMISGNNESNLQYLLIFNTKNKKIVLESVFNSVEVTKAEIKALKEDKDNFGYGKVYCFNIATKKISNYNVYTKSIKFSDQPELITFQFLKSLQYSDYKHSLSFLENKDATSEKLEKYFGKIEEIFFNGYTDDVNYTIFADNKYRNFTFQIANNKIIDIEENPL